MPTQPSFGSSVRKLLAQISAQSLAANTAITARQGSLATQVLRTIIIYYTVHIYKLKQHTYISTPVPLRISVERSIMLTLLLLIRLLHLLLPCIARIAKIIILINRNTTKRSTRVCVCVSRPPYALAAQNAVDKSTCSRSSLVHSTPTWPRWRRQRRHR